MKHEKTFDAIGKLKDIELELHRLKNALEMANKGLDAQHQWVGLTEQDMPSGEDPMFDHQYFIAGLVYADKVLKERNT